MEEWRVLPYGRFDAPYNMAVDEAVLRCHLRESNPPTLRLYGWVRPAVSLGRFQKTADVINSRYCSAHGIDIVRRPTGGRAVCHGHDLTYSVVSQEEGMRFRSGIMDTYRTLSECIRRGLQRAGIETSMADTRGAGNYEDAGGCCFSVPAQHELLAGGRKICGSAQMRMRGAFLQHGSILRSLDARQMCMILNHTCVDCADIDTFAAPMSAGVKVSATRTNTRGMDFRLRRNGGMDDSSPAALEAAVAKLKKRVTAVDEHVPAGMTSEVLCRHIERGFEEYLGIRLVPGGLTEGEKKEAQQLREVKYLTEEWNGGQGVS